MKNVLQFVICYLLYEYFIYSTYPVFQIFQPNHTCIFSSNWEILRLKLAQELNIPVSLFNLEKATSENNTTEQWDTIIDICDKASANSKNAKECIKSIMKRMGEKDPHVAIQAITLLDSCIKNCGKTFHLEIASRDFETEFQRIMLKNSLPVAQKMRV